MLFKHDFYSTRSTRSNYLNQLVPVNHLSRELDVPLTSISFIIWCKICMRMDVPFYPFQERQLRSPPIALAT